MKLTPEDVLFLFLQFELCGIPIVICHAVGVIGGTLSYFILQYVGFLEYINFVKG